MGIRSRWSCGWSRRRRTPWANAAAGAFAGALGKARGHALRLATVIEFLWWAGESGGPEPMQISVGAVEAACGLLDDYFIPMTERVYGDAAVPAAERHAMTLVRHLRRERYKTFNARTLRREIGGALRAAAVMDTACATLLESGLIRAVERKPTGPGRPAHDFHVNPVLHGGCARCQNSDRLPEGVHYRRRVLDDRYWPDLAGFVADYLAANPNRKRPLDLLPVLAVLAPEQVRGSLPHEKIGARPVLHYRLPQAHVGEPGWSIMPDWGRWLCVESCASDLLSACHVA